MQWVRFRRTRELVDSVSPKEEFMEELETLLMQVLEPDDPA